MDKFFTQCVETYEKLAGPDYQCTPADTPFIAEDKGVVNPTRHPSNGDTGYVCPHCTEAYPEESFIKVHSAAEAEKIAKRLREAVNAGQPNASECSESLPADTGTLAPIAAQVVMKVFYGARVARPDLMRAIGHLSRYLTRWTKQCDERLHRLMCYLKGTVSEASVGWIGDPPSECRLHLYTDSDFAGCQQSNRCTSGVFLVLEGPNTYYPIGYYSKMLPAVAYSTPEGEMAAWAFGIRVAGFPGMVMWEALSGQRTICRQSVSDPIRPRCPPIPRYHTYPGNHTTWPRR